jgi:rhodanese-related sulfurtransferase
LSAGGWKNWRPVTIPGITSDELLRKLEDGEPLVLVDALAPMVYAHSHLPGAINLPPIAVDSYMVARRIPDRNMEIVVYCASPNCEDSLATGVQLQELGYTNVRHYPGGKNEWRDAGLPLERAGKPFVAAYRRQGFVFGKPGSRLTKRITPSINALKLLFDGDPKPLRICGVKCEAFVEHARENTWRIGPDGQVLGLNDDIHNHAMRAAAYYVVAKFPPRDEPGISARVDEPAQEEHPLTRRRRRARQGDLAPAFSAPDSSL